MMDSEIHFQNKNIRKIEDLIEIQKANGSYNVRQVAFNLPSEAESTATAKSLESGLVKNKSDNIHKKKVKKLRSKREKIPLPDVISWPSDSDITVLRMKLCLTSSDMKKKVDNIPGDGLHLPDSSSMINLATLIIQSRSPSKHSLIEEYLLPLTSWEPENQEQETKAEVLEDTLTDDNAIRYHRDYDAMCSHSKLNENFLSDDSEIYSKRNMKSKVAKFLRLYFCPCCTCLYRLETMRDDPSVYFTPRQEQLKI